MNALKGFALLSIVFGLASTSALAGGEKLAGSIKADGSSTVYLITEAMAAQFTKLHPDVRISVAIAGTGGGFKKFAAGETDISDASRAIKPQEADNCKKNGIDYVELQVAWDGLAVIIHPDNTWARKLTVEQLKKIWHPNTASFKNARTWSDVDPNWPNEELKLFGADSDSGTFDYFTEAINGKEKLIRTDYTPSADDNIIVNGVKRNKYAIGFLGVAYYEQNKDELAVVQVQNPKTKEFFAPTPDAVLSRKYAPLSRPLFIYVKATSMKRPEVREFVKYYMRSPEVVRSSKYVPLNNLQSLKERKKLDEALKVVN